jgi:hypothetical protein
MLPKRDQCELTGKLRTKRPLIPAVTGVYLYYSSFEGSAYQPVLSRSRGQSATHIAIIPVSHCSLNTGGETANKQADK